MQVNYEDVVAAFPLSQLDTTKDGEFLTMHIGSFLSTCAGKAKQTGTEAVPMSGNERSGSLKGHLQIELIGAILEHVVRTAMLRRMCMFQMWAHSSPLLLP